MSTKASTRAKAKVKPKSQQDPAELVAAVKEKIRLATAEAAVVTKQLPIRPWKDTTNRFVEEMVILAEQLVLIIPEEVWGDITEEIPPILDELIARVMAAEERAQNEWERRRVVEDRLATSEEKVNGWKVIAEDLTGVLWSDRAKAAEAQIPPLLEALQYYASRDNWNPEPRILEGGVSINDRGGIARAALEEV